LIEMKRPWHAHGGDEIGRPWPCLSVDRGSSAPPLVVVILTTGTPCTSGDNRCTHCRYVV
jgi:hypothetical protein